MLVRPNPELTVYLGDVVYDYVWLTRGAWLTRSHSHILGRSLTAEAGRQGEVFSEPCVSY